MNAVQQILKALTDVELKEALAEMKELEETAVLKQGIVRNLVLKLQHDIGLSAHDARSVAHSSIFRVAAFRWAGYAD